MAAVASVSVGVIAATVLACVAVLIVLADGLAGIALVETGVSAVFVAVETVLVLVAVAGLEAVVAV